MFLGMMLALSTACGGPDATDLGDSSSAIRPSITSITASDASVPFGETPVATVQLVATVVGTKTHMNNSATWELDPTVDGCGQLGASVTADGVFSAPASPQTYIGGNCKVIAAAVADPTKTAVSTVTITAPASAPTPTPTALTPTVPVTPTQPPPPAPSAVTTGTGATHAPAYITVTGGGAMPSTSGAPLASCAGNGSTDDTVCLQSAIKSAASAGKPLLIPAMSSYYRITAPLIVTTSLIGINGMPTIKQTSTCGTAACDGLQLAANMTGWIYNLHIVGMSGSGGGGGEFAHNIDIGGVNGVTIKGNLLETPQGDNIADNMTSLGVTAHNVLITNNTMRNWYRCMVSLTGVSDGWAIMNNYATDDVAYVSPIDLEPYRSASYISNIEVGYNQIVTPANPAQTSAGNYVGVITASGWADATPGQNVYSHHNYGSWPFSSFVYKTTGGGAGGIFSNVVDSSNVQGSSPPP